MSSDVVQNGLATRRSTVRRSQRTQDRFSSSPDPLTQRNAFVAAGDIPLSPIRQSRAEELSSVQYTARTFQRLELIFEQTRVASALLLVVRSMPTTQPDMQPVYEKIPQHPSQQEDETRDHMHDAELVQEDLSETGRATRRRWASTYALTAPAFLIAAALLLIYATRYAGQARCLLGNERKYLNTYRLLLT